MPRGTRCDSGTSRGRMDFAGVTQLRTLRWGHPGPCCEPRGITRILVRGRWRGWGDLEAKVEELQCWRGRMLGLRQPERPGEGGHPCDALIPAPVRRLASLRTAPRHRSTSSPKPLGAGSGPAALGAKWTSQGPGAQTTVTSLGESLPQESTGTPTHTTLHPAPTFHPPPQCSHCIPERTVRPSESYCFLFCL